MLEKPPKAGDSTTGSTKALMSLAAQADRWTEIPAAASAEQPRGEASDGESHSTEGSRQPGHRARPRRASSRQPL